MNLAAPPGFQGLQPHLEVKMYERNLPHWRQEGATYFVTFRLADSLPKVTLDHLAEFRSKWILQHGEDDKDTLAKAVMNRIEAWLDQGMGNCCLKQSIACNHVADALRFYDGKRYLLGCYTIMPNHVHAVICPLNSTEHSLEKCLQSVKGFSAREINASLKTTGIVWQDESFDRIVRDVEHLYRVVQYIGNNPAKAGIPLSVSPRWINPTWAKSGWRFDWV